MIDSSKSVQGFAAVFNIIQRMGVVMRIQMKVSPSVRGGGNVGVCMMQGREGRRFPRNDVALGVMCRVKADEDRESMIRFLRKWQNWFCQELPGIFQCLSYDIVCCYWRDLIFSSFESWKMGWQPADFAAFFIVRGEYIFCGAGNLTVIQYDCRRDKWNPWYTCSERRQFENELGVDGEFGIYFKNRKISQDCSIILSTEKINPKCYNSENIYMEITCSVH